MQDDAGTRTALAPAPGTVLGSDPHGFAALYIRHRASFTSHARRYLRDPRDADEVVQEAFLRLFLAMPELETELQALAYCRRTITNLCIDRYRADARRPRLVALEGAPVDALAEDDTGDPVVRAEDAALVRQALSQLPELHRAALVMREIEEKPLPVIADELDVAEDNVKHLLFRARRHLRRLLAHTSVAPGADAELTRGLRPVARGASGGAAGLLLLALLGLGSGPDLRAVPVVGVDLPDVLGVTVVADAVGGAVRDVVQVIVPGRRAAASARDLDSRPVSRSEAPSGTQAPATGERAQSARSAAAGSPGADPVAPGSGRTTTVVTVVDGRPVISVVPVERDLPAAAPATAPGVANGRGPGPYPPTPVALLPTGGRDLPAGTPVGPLLPEVDAPAGPSAPDSSGRSPRAKDAVHDDGRAAAPAEDRAQRVDRASERRAETAADPVEKAQDRIALQAAQRADQAAEKAARVAERAAQMAARAEADRAAGAASQRAAAERVAAKQAAAERLAAERAAAVRAAELAAAEAAAQAAEGPKAAAVAAKTAAQAAGAAKAAAAAKTAAKTAAAAPVTPGATPVVPVPAP